MNISVRFASVPVEQEALLLLFFGLGSQCLPHIPNLQIKLLLVSSQRRWVVSSLEALAPPLLLLSILDSSHLLLLLSSCFSPPPIPSVADHHRLLYAAKTSKEELSFSLVSPFFPSSSFSPLLWPMKVSSFLLH